MEKLSLVFDAKMPSDIKEFLTSVYGINKVDIISEINYGVRFDFEYDKKAIKPQAILEQIELYMKAYWRPALVGFDKHSNNYKKVTYKEPNLCCEFCYLNLVNELFYNDNVNSFKHLTDDVCNYSYKKYKDFLITYLTDKKYIDDTIKKFSSD